MNRHADDEFGRRAGFKGLILQGLGTWNIAAHGILRELGGADPARFKVYGARFKSVVYPGDTLVTRMWKVGVEDGCDKIHFETVVQEDGRVALCVAFPDPRDCSKANMIPRSNGYARLKQKSSKL